MDTAPDGSAPPAILLHPERTVIEADGTLSVRGWVVSEEEIAGFRLDGNEIAVESGFPRPDVAALKSHYPNAETAGFQLRLRLDDLSAPLLLEVLTISGLSQTIRLCPERQVIPPRAADPRRMLRLFCDEAVLRSDAVVLVSGWAISPIGVRDVRVFLGDLPLGEVEFGLPRDDVGDEFPAIPMARFSGFRARFSLDPEVPKPDEVRLVAHNTLDDETQVVRTLELRAAPEPSATPPVPEVFRIEVDSPAIMDGQAIEIIGKRLTIDGWVLVDGGVDSIDIILDEQPVGRAHYGIVRQDVARAFPHREDAVRSGYAFHFPPRLLRPGQHVAELRVLARNGQVQSRSIGFEVREADDPGSQVNVRTRTTRAEVVDYAATLQRHEAAAQFGLVLRFLDGDDPEKLRITLSSLSGQLYQNWRLMIVGNGALPDDLGTALASRTMPANQGIWPSDIDFVGFLAPGDRLGTDALAEFALEAALTRHADFLYADELRSPWQGGLPEPFYKPAFSPHLLLGCNYIGRPWFASVRLLESARLTPGALAAASEYDAILRCTEQAEFVRHIPKLLLERGDSADSDETERAALAEASVRRSQPAEIVPGVLPNTWRVTHAPQPRSVVSVIIPTCAAEGHIETCLRALRATAAGHELEIICIENIPEDRGHWRAWLKQNADVVLSTTEPFNWSRFNNLAAARATGDYLLFLNDDVEPEDSGWLDVLIQHAHNQQVGVVGARLLYPNRTVQHAGMFLTAGGVGRHAFRFAGEDDPCYFGLALMEREVSAVTGACMLMRRSHFDLIGGFDESHDIINNDVDFCLRTTEAGFQVLYTPLATLVHHEQASRASMPDRFDNGKFFATWRARLGKGDPYHNPNLSAHHDDIRPEEEPLRVVHAGHPLFAPEDIQRILAIKVDHIGDFITALRAIRKLKAIFPNAEISVLAAPSAQSFAALEPAIARIIPHEFFHARSALGQKKELEEADIAALREKLQPYNFDLAIDLRKHLDTRPLLLGSGARLLAGFDHSGQFPWLDIALEWEGDRGLHPKRAHIVDDLLNLIQAIGTASEAERSGLTADAIAALQKAHPAPDKLRRFFRKPVVCVHPGAGNEMKEWPERFFIALIDLLVQDLGVNVLLIGGPDEAEIAGRLARNAADPVAVRSVAGLVSLRALPALISRCALFVGNDSGPKHIAALVGIPTIGIHSGTVDPAEWAPFGPNAVAVARSVTCSPCYLNRLSDCVRNLACIRGIEPHAVFDLCRRALTRNFVPSR